jgi:hypothetical protein
MEFDNLHPDPVKCPRCGKTGCLFWEAEARGSIKELVRIDGGFYERLAKRRPHPIELVCQGCGTVQRELGRL